MDFYEHFAFFSNLHPKGRIWWFGIFTSLPGLCMGSPQAGRQQYCALVGQFSDLGSSAAAAAMSNLFTSKQYMNEEIVFLSSVSGDKCDVWLLQLMWKLRTWCRSSLSGPRRVTVSPVFPSLSLRRLFVYCKPHCTALFVRLREPWWNQSPLTWKAALRWL